MIVSVIATRKEDPEVITVNLDVKPELKQTVTASGEVRPIRYIKLTSEVPGRIEEIYVNAGDMVTKGKPLVRIDPTQLQSNQEAQWAATQAAINDVQNARNAVNSAQQAFVVAEASVASARQQVVAFQTAVDRAQVDVNTAQRELKRNTELIEAGVSSRFEYDSARDRFDTAKIALETAKANLEAQKIAVKEATERANQQRIAVKEAQTSIKSSEMRANQQSAMLRGQLSQRSKATQVSPLNGVVADIPTRVGEFAVAGFSTTPLMTIADMSQINVEVNVDETSKSITSRWARRPRLKLTRSATKRSKQSSPRKTRSRSRSQIKTGGLSNRVNVQEAKEFKVTLELSELPEDIQEFAAARHEFDRHDHD